MRRFLFILTIVFVLQSCVDLKEINTFAKTSDATLQSVSDNGYSFTSSYLNYTTTQPFYNFNPEETQKNKISLPTTTISASDLKLAQDADKTIDLFASSMQAYLQGLAKLSDQGLINYDYSGVGASIKSQAAVMAKLGISGNDVDDALNIARVATNVIMGKYREKVLRDVIINHNTSFKNAADALKKCLGALSLNETADVQLLQTRYAPLLADPSLPFDKKFEWRKEYADGMSDLEKKKAVIEKQIQAVDRLKNAHDAIALQLANSKLDSKAVIALIRTHSAEIKSVFSSIKQLIK